MASETPLRAADAGGWAAHHDRGAPGEGERNMIPYLGNGDYCHAAGSQR